MRTGQSIHAPARRWTYWKSADYCICQSSGRSDYVLVGFSVQWVPYPEPVRRIASLGNYHVENILAGMQDLPRTSSPVSSRRRRRLKIFHLIPEASTKHSTRRFCILRCGCLASQCPGGGPKRSLSLKNLARGLRGSGVSFLTTSKKRYMEQAPYISPY